MSKEELISMLNHALDLEHSAHIQYLSHAEMRGRCERRGDNSPVEGDRRR